MIIAVAAGVAKMNKASFLATLSALLLTACAQPPATSAPEPVSSPQGSQAPRHIPADGAPDEAAPSVIDQFALAVAKELAPTAEEMRTIITLAAEYRIVNGSWPPNKAKLAIFAAGKPEAESLASYQRLDFSEKDGAVTLVFTREKNATGPAADGTITMLFKDPFPGK